MTQDVTIKTDNTQVIINLQKENAELLAKLKEVKEEAFKYARLAGEHRTKLEEMQEVIREMAEALEDAHKYLMPNERETKALARAKPYLGEM